MASPMFKKGDIVRLERPHKDMGRYGFKDTWFGNSEWEIILTTPSNTGDPHYCMVMVNDQSKTIWGAYESMLSHLPPMSEFDKSVRSYIDRELS